MHRTSVLLMVSLAFAAANAQETQIPALAQRPYVDKLNGFSLRPPAQAVRIREKSASLLVRWEQRDAATGAIAWTFSVSRFEQANADLTLDQYAAALAQNLRQAEGFEVESTQLIERCGKKSIMIQGLTAKPLRQWRRQEWVLVNHDGVLLFEIVGPVTMRDRLGQLAESIMASAAFLDPEVELARQRESIDRGMALLKEIDEGRIRGSIESAPQWFTMRLKGKPIGWAVQMERVATRDKSSGLELRMGTILTLPDGSRSQKQVIFVSFDGRVEHWSDRLLLTANGNTTLISEKGFRQDEAILCSGRQGEQTWEQQKAMPPGMLERDVIQQVERNMPQASPDQKAAAIKSMLITVQDFYLSRATGMILPRLMDLSSLQAYSFAVYNTRINDFELRTFTLLGKSSIDLNGAKVSAVHLTDVSAGGESAPADWWLDEGGRMLRLSTDDGFVMESAPQEDVFNQDPRARQAIDDLMK
jgi:hypothetical protein